MIFHILLKYRRALVPTSRPKGITFLNIEFSIWLNKRNKVLTNGISNLIKIPDNLSTYFTTWGEQPYYLIKPAYNSYIINRTSNIFTFPVDQVFCFGKHIHFPEQKIIIALLAYHRVV